MTEPASDPNAVDPTDSGDPSPIINPDNLQTVKLPVISDDPSLRYAVVVGDLATGQIVMTDSTIYDLSPAWLYAESFEHVQEIVAAIQPPEDN